MKKHSQLYFGTLVLASYCCCGDSTENNNFTQNTGLKESRNMALQKSQSNNKHLSNVMSSSYHIK